MPTPCNLCYVLDPVWEDSDTAVCSKCGAPTSVRVFPAMFQPRVATTQVSAEEGDAACYDHPNKRAVAHCGQCGRFVCALCSVDFRGEVWCPQCMAAGVEKKRTVELEQSRTLYDSLALAIVLTPLLIWPLTIFSAPAALFVAIRYWNRPLSLVRRSRWRAILAILIALAQIIAWTWFFVYIVMLQRPAR